MVIVKRNPAVVAVVEPETFTVQLSAAEACALRALVGASSSNGDEPEFNKLLIALNSRLREAGVEVRFARTGNGHTPTFVWGS